MKSIISLLFIFLCSYPILTYGQQQPNFTQFRNQFAVINPAGLSIDYIREDLNVTFSASHRQQWIGVDNNPHTSFISAKWLPYTKNISLGFYALNDEIGAISNLRASFSFAYLARFKSNKILSLGVSGNLGGYRVNVSEILSHTQINANNISKDNFQDVGVGLFFTNRKYYVGLAIPQLCVKEMCNRNFETGDGGIQIRGKTHFYLRGGWYIRINRGNATFIEPSLLLRYIPGSDFEHRVINLDVNVRIKFHDNIWFGVGGGNSINAEIGFILGQDSRTKIGLSYNTRPLRDNNKVLGNTFECNFTYSLEW